MNATDAVEVIAKSKRGTDLLLWALIAIYAVARVLQVFPDRVPMGLIVTLHVFPPIIFALIHGATRYRIRGILIFFLTCLIVGNVVENIGVITGFPYGRYYFTDVMGPKLFNVPIMLGLAYLGMGYLSWTLACTILRSARSSIRGSLIIVVHVVASFVMVAWDLAMDPIWGTVLHAWIWQRGGPYFGVPISNFVGWYLTVYLIFQFFALYLRGQSADANSLRPNYWHLAVIFYAVSAAGNILLMTPHAGLLIVTDPSGVQWKVSEIAQASALVSIFIMGGFALLAWIRIGGRSTNHQSGFERTRRGLEA
jgi:uncharacterized membrane protein